MEFWGLGNMGMKGIVGRWNLRVVELGIRIFFAERSFADEKDWNE